MPWTFDHKKGCWVNGETGEILKNAPTSGTGTAFDTNQTVKNLVKSATTQTSLWKVNDSSSTDEKQKGVECPGHKEALLVLKKNIKVWAGAATKTEWWPDGAVILDLANKYGCGIRGEGIELPAELQTKRIVFDWPDMSKPYLFKSEWEVLTDFLKSREDVKEHGLYVACLEGHGRTGTALSILAHFFGEWNDNVDVVRQIRKKYCRKAVETATQIEYFEKMTGRKTKCIGSNVYSGTGGTYKSYDCLKHVKGLRDCIHNCTSSSEKHTEHWCGKCKIDWYVNENGLFEKGSPGYKADEDHKNWVCTPGKHVVSTIQKDGKVTMTETYDAEGKTFNVISPIKDNKDVGKRDRGTADGVNTCWNTSPFALGPINGECENSDEEHLCGVEKDHPGRHVCILCGGVWDKRKGPDMQEHSLVPSTEGSCMAAGGNEPDHRCLCTEPFGHEGDDVFGFAHKCSTCGQLFEESEINE